MESIGLNHRQILATFSKLQPAQGTEKAPYERVFTSDQSSSPSDIVTLSPEASRLSHDYQMTPRFSSMEEQSEHKTRIVSTWVTKEKLESGARRPFASPEDERLSHLSLKELMVESLKLPNVDKNGHLQTGFAGTEQGDRIDVAIANIQLETQYNYRKAAKNVEASVEEFKQYMKDDFNIDPDSYDIVFLDGKVAVTSNGNSGLNFDSLNKIEGILDNPEKIAEASGLIQAIEAFNESALKVIENSLTSYIQGPQQNRYLPEEVSGDWLLEGMNYSSASTGSHIHGRYLTIIAESNERYHAALHDGTHLKNSTDPGILELTRIRAMQHQGI